MKKYYKFKIKHKKSCENISVESVRHVFEEDIIKFLPLRDKHGSRIVYIACGSKFEFINLIHNYKRLVNYY